MHRCLAAVGNVEHKCLVAASEVSAIAQAAEVPPASLEMVAAVADGVMTKVSQVLEGTPAAVADAVDESDSVEVSQVSERLLTVGFPKVCNLPSACGLVCEKCQPSLIAAACAISSEQCEYTHV